MSSNETTQVIEILPPDSPRRRPALRLILSGDTRPNPNVEQRLRTLEDNVAARGMNLDLLVVASKGKRLTRACFAVESPGRSAIVHLSPLGDFEARHDVSVLLLRELQDHAWQRGIVLLQAMMSPEETQLERFFAEAGFRFLAEIIYADRARGTPTSALPETLKLEWVTYSARQHDLFLRGLEQTYTDSLDCAGLSGVRRTADVLATHRATGRHDPSLWFLAKLNGRTAGVLLLSPLPDRSLFEVAYMGVAHGFRRRNIGHALMRKCNDAMISRGFAGVTLAIDSVNTPARALYRRWGFVEQGRRRAWIAVRPE